jgi:arabinogalactan oligomer / maltooligosaccharide transport system permease protein
MKAAYLNAALICSFFDGGCMKFISILKAIASGLVWGLGQLFNGQFLKALFFFGFFTLLIGIELGTSKYFEETNAYDKMIGVDLGDTWYTNGFLPEYRFDNVNYQPFEDLLTSIGGDQNLTEEIFIKFLADDLKANNPNTYRDIIDNITYLADEFNDTGKIHVIRRQNLWLDEDTGIFYLERDGALISGNPTKEYVETTVLTGITNESNIRSTRDGLVSFNKTGQVVRNSGIYYVRATQGGSVIKMINIFTEEVVDNMTATNIPLQGPLYILDGKLFEYFQPGLIYNSQRLQYKETPIFSTFRLAMRNTYSFTWNRYTRSDFTRLMIKVYFELNPEIKTAFEEGFNDFYFDRAGLFIRGYWAVYTLGTTYRVNYTGHMALYDAMIGTSTSENTLANLASVQPLEEVPIRGHVSTMLLLEGLIGVISSLILSIFMIWSIVDAYRVSEAKRKKELVLGDINYFKDVYERSFEYIVLSPAMFVLAFISIMPIVFGFVMAFTNISGNASMVDTFDWVGLRNFFALFNFASGLGASFGQAFWRVLGWTIVWAIFSTFTVFFGGFFQALVLNSEKVVFRKLWRTILILPWAIPALLSQMVFSVMFKEFGFVNALLNDIGIYDFLRNIGMLGVEYHTLTGIAKFFYIGQENIQWFSNEFNPTFVRTVLIVVNIWLGFPYFMALMTGVMTAIDQTLYEAADIDGANRFQKISQITMPLVLYSTAPILIMTFSGNFNNFGVIYFITQGGPNTGFANRGFAGDTDILISWMYKLTVDYSIFNMASVFSVLIFLFVGSLTAWNLSRTRAFQED